MKILIIEDDPIQALNLKIQLRDLGYTDVHTASNLGQVCLETQTNLFDLVFCDIHLPDTDGITLLAEHLNKDVAKAVIIVSVVNDSILKLSTGMCSQLGYRFVSALQKPFESHQLTTVLHSYESSLQQSHPSNIVVSLTESDIEKAFETDAFFCVYQPQFSFDSSRLVGIEALARLEHPNYGVVSALHFIPLVTRMGLMKELFITVLSKAVSAVSTLGSSVKLSLNVTQDLLDEDLTTITTRICDTHCFPLTNLTFELTEEQAYNSSHIALANIARLNIKGVEFSIDDFGTGYASLEKLVDMPFSELKIDKLFISRAKESYRHQQLVMSCVRLAQSLGIHCVAEGVEDAETWDLLKKIGVDTCQGFYTGMPMSILELAPLCKIVKDEVAQNAPNSVVIYVDSDLTRGLATLKLVAKELTQSHVIHIANFAELGNAIRDYPVSLIVIDSDILDKLTELEKGELSNVKLKVNSVVLVDSENKTASLPLQMPHIVKSEVITSTAKLIAHHVDNLAHNQTLPDIKKLSVRERTVAKLLLAGFSNKYIAYELGISEKTVSTFKGRILSKLQIKTLVDLGRIINFE